jgi:nicotinate phosphoribosyltransferase
VSPSLSDVREHAAAELATLPAGLRNPLEPASYAVEVSATIRALAVEADLSAHHGGTS